MRLKLIVALVSDEKTDIVIDAARAGARPAPRSSPACTARTTRWAWSGSPTSRER